MKNTITYINRVEGIDGVRSAKSNNGWISIDGEIEIGFRLFEGHADADRVAGTYMNVAQAEALIKSLQQAVKAVRFNAGRI